MDFDRVYILGLFFSVPMYLIERNFIVIVRIISTLGVIA